MVLGFGTMFLIVTLMAAGGGGWLWFMIWRDRNMPRIVTTTYAVERPAVPARLRRRKPSTPTTPHVVPAMLGGTGNGTAARSKP